jgi:hypothetical protein
MRLNFLSLIKSVASKVSSFFQPYITAVTKFIDDHLETAALFVFDHKYAVLGADAFVSAVLYSVGLGSWALWAHVLMVQNWAFTYVSRARNSASLSRHLKAGFFSNGVWFASQTIIVAKLFDYVQGKFGLRMAIFTGLFYTAFTLTGSIMAHAQSLRSEKGKSAVGANKKYAQITVEEWESTKALLARLRMVAIPGDNL